VESIRQFLARLAAADSAQAHEINSLFYQFLIVAAIIAALVTGIVVYSAIRYRRSRRLDEPAQVHGNRRLEIVWTVAALLTVGYFFVLTARAMVKINQSFGENPKPDIVVTAHQWWWDMRYPQQHVITANELHIPAGKRLLMQIQSADVVHDWWVPQLGRKIDAVPGRVNHTWIQADKPGIYEGTCSEYCGAQHAWMRIRVVAEPEDQFNRWLEQQEAPGNAPGDTLAVEGQRLFEEKSCAECHAVRGTPAKAHIGPDLTHLGSRQTILSGMLSNTPEHLHEWLQNPQKIKKGANMPNFMLSDHEINALVAYLKGLK